MAEKEPKTAPRRLRKTETVREKAVKASTQEPKPRRLHRTAGHVARPLKGAARLGRREYHLPVVGKKDDLFLNQRVRFVPPFVREAWAELRQVTWPSKRETAKLTMAVFIFAVIFGLAIALVDYGLGNIFRKLFLS